MRVKQLNQKGFSLIELMIVVGIIGVLATMAVPKFSAFQAKAKQTEAKTTLNHIYTLQEAYFIDYSFYSTSAGQYGADPANAKSKANCDVVPAWAASIGFTLTPCNAQKPIYYYTVPTVGASSTYVATASTGADAANKLFPNCPSADVWTMTNTHALTPVQNGIEKCN